MAKLLLKYGADLTINNPNGSEGLTPTLGATKTIVLKLMSVAFEVISVAAP